VYVHFQNRPEETFENQKNGASKVRT